ncbi:unnamed protein product [Hapterophycus canaliculatus]
MAANATALCWGFVCLVVTLADGVDLLMVPLVLLFQSKEKAYLGSRRWLLSVESFLDHPPTPSFLIFALSRDRTRAVKLFQGQGGYAGLYYGGVTGPHDGTKRASGPFTFRRW